MPGNRLLMNVYLGVDSLTVRTARRQTLVLGPCTFIRLETMILLNTLLNRLLGQPPFYEPSSRVAWTLPVWVSCMSVTTLGSRVKKWNTWPSRFLVRMIRLAPLASVLVRRPLNVGILSLLCLRVRTGPQVVLSVHLAFSYLCTIVTNVATLTDLLVV